MVEIEKIKEKGNNQEDSDMRVKLFLSQMYLL